MNSKRNRISYDTTIINTVLERGNSHRIMSIDRQKNKINCFIIIEKKKNVNIHHVLRNYPSRTFFIKINKQINNVL